MGIINTTTFMILNKIDSRDLGVYIVDPLPAVTTGAKRIERYPVIGLSGTKTYFDGTYEDTEKICNLYFKDIDEQRVLEFLSNPQIVTFSNEPDKEYLCSLAGEISVERIRRRRFKFEYVLVCHPLKRQRVPDVFQVDGGLQLANSTNEKAYPSFDITGSGNITIHVGAQFFVLQGVAGSATVEGADIFEAFDNSGLINNRMIGDFPEILPGEVLAISVTNGAAKVRPNWRWH